MKPKQKLVMYDLYVKAFANTLDAYLDNREQDTKPFVKKMIVYGVKAINAKGKSGITTQAEAESDFEYAGMIKSLMGSLTPEEFVNLFPIRKEYKGHRYEAKDYFYTRDYLKTLDQDKPIGEEVTTFLWEYTNREISFFIVNCMGYMDNLRRLAGQASMMEEWAGIMGARTHTMHTDQKGKQFLYDKETGKTTKVKKERPKYLKLVK